MKPIPLYLIHGWIGSGKSQFIKAWVEEARRRSQRLAVVKDDGRSDLKRLLDECRAETSFDEAPLDAILVEVDGTVEPMAVAELFTFHGEAGEPPLTDYEVAGCFTVIDASQLMFELSSGDSLESLGLTKTQAGDLTRSLPRDTRHVADVVIEQIEFADFLILNRFEGMDTTSAMKLKNVLEWLNPRADVIEVSLQNSAVWTEAFSESFFGNLKSRTFDFFDAEEGAGWLQLIDGVHPKLDRNVGVSGFIFRTRRPFHPERLNQALEDLKTKGVLRIKGWVWIASRPEIAGLMCVAGPALTLLSSGEWLDPSLRLPSTIDTERRLPGVEIAIMGLGLNELDVRRRFKRCLLTDEEMRAGPDLWKTFTDPLPPWTLGDLDDDHDWPSDDDWLQ